MQGTQCMTCQHYIDASICPAYIDGIPAEIMAGKVRHDTVRDDQEGTLVYERSPLAEDLFDEPESEGG